MTDDILSLAKQLIACPSVTPHDAGCQKMIMDRLDHLGFQCERMQFGDVDNLWARYGKHAPLVVFAGHTDVVPPGPVDEWTSPPFQPAIRENYLYGRGASDMKGALAAMVIAVERFLNKKSQCNGSIAFLLTSDEEAAAINGTRKVIEVLQQRGETIDYCIIGEPSSEALVGDQVRIGRRGSLHGTLTIHGKQGHVAHPHLANNPIHKSMSALNEIIHMEWDKGNEHFPATTLQITTIQSGTGATNVIPGHLVALFNFRFSTALTIQELQERTEAILHKHELSYDLKWEVGGKPFLTQPGKLLTITQLAIKEITNLDPKLSTGGGTSDGRFIAPTGAKIIELGVSHATAHQIDECVQIDDLQTLALIYEKMLILLL
ncbi:MAG: succinyl-diaminopimelate desuccinylase [Gammaproteobacteria bacterium RIFCSPHIGHO2_12_FULL_37_34]|nr:MAG: succinyl-diaminopimelate desuccinylase [Gammaproteobacteria bacterium RIFCSPHIGHO2_12_FULL_37_34]